MRRLLLPFVALLAVVAHADDSSPVRFRLHVPDEAVRVARLSGKPAPSGRLVLLAGGAFTLETDGATRKGTFKNLDGRLTLTAEDGTELRGELKDGKATLEGLAFDKEVPLDMAGMWTTRRNGYEEKGLRMELKKDGTFRFTMAGATSEGSWSAEGGKLNLVWTKIDGEAVEAGTVRKEFPIGEDGVFFRIDTYRYERATSG